MFKHTLFFAFFALFAVFASAAEAPPACVLACVNEETKHSDFKAVCNSKNMHPCLKTKCASADLEDAVSHFQTTCKAQGQTALLVKDEDEDEDSKGGSKGNSTKTDSTDKGASGSGSSKGDADSDQDDADSGAALHTISSVGLVSAFVAGLLCIV